MSILRIKDKDGNWVSITSLKGDKGDTPDLTDYATKEYVEQEIATFDFIKIVDELPETGLENRMYLVPKNDTQTQDLFDEYVWINNKWEWITTKQIEVDLTPYAKKSEVPNEVAISSTEPTTGEEVWIQKGKNLIDKTKITTGYELLGNGGIQTNNDWFVTDYIKVEPNKQYCISGIFSDAEGLTASTYIEFYDENHNYISGVRENPTTTPSNAKYVRLNGITSVSKNMMLEQGEAATSYKPYIDKKIYTKNDNGVYEEFYDEEKTNKVNYLTEEQVIGTWIDGKPLYRKVISTGALQTSSETSIDCGKNIASFVHVYGQATGLQNNVSLNYHLPDKNIGLRISYSRYILVSNDTGVELTDGFVIIEYTKTTD